MLTNRIPSIAALLGGLVLAGCASEDAWLCPRGPDGATGVVACPAPAAPERTTVRAPAVAEPVAAPRADASLGSLRTREERLADDYYAMRSAREHNIALAAALAAWGSNASAQNRQHAEEALDRYRADPTLQRIGGAASGVAGLGTGVAPDLRDRLAAEERDLSRRAAALQSARKANIALVTALQQVVRDGGTPKSRDAAAKARETYESSEGALARGE